MEFKLFNEIPAYVGPEWHKTRQVADHINEPGQRERLLETANLVDSLAPLFLSKTVEIADWGAGNGGLLSELRERFTSRGAPLKAWGYDLMPSNVEYARSVYDVNVKLLDIVNGEPGAADIVILTEILEHLVEPHALLAKLRRYFVHEYVIASSPAAETPENHYEFHLFAWTGNSYAEMFQRAGYRVLRHFVTAFNGTQFIVAKNGNYILESRRKDLA